MKRIMYGGDYNPGQWPREIWDEDMRFFKEAHINTATVNVFSWAKLQPDEDSYDFSELDDIVEMLSKENFSIIMATSTASLPAWLVKKYPEVTRTDFCGTHKKFGKRHNFCPNSNVFKTLSAKLAYKLAERYKNNANIVCWHIGNEYEGECYCENCEKAFRAWLKNKYGTIETLNKAWNTEFWGHTFYDWDEIVLPDNLGDGEAGIAFFAGLSIDYNRFNSESLLNCFKLERDAVRSVIPDAVITTNLMGPYKPLDYFKWAKEMDIVSWDCYPSYDTPWSEVAMNHDLMRSLKNQPFLLMEQTPSQQNWQPYNSLKKPGQMRAQSYQCMAHGGDSVLFFQLRQSTGGCEKFHGAVISHAGTDQTRVFREVAHLGSELENLSEIIGLDKKSQVGIVFDWENFWALEHTVGPTRDLRYLNQIHNYYKYFYENNISVDFISVESDLSKYKLIIAPVLYMVKEGFSVKLEQYVNNGGILVTGFMSGIVDENDNVYTGGYPGPLRKLCGVWAEEIDALAPEQTNILKFDSGEEYSCNMLCDILHTEGAEALAFYGSDFYAGTPAVTVNNFGKGKVFYLGTQPSKDGLSSLLEKISAQSGVKAVIDEKSCLEITCRENGDNKYYFIINFTAKEQILPKSFIGKKNLLNGEALTGDTRLKQYDAVLVKC